MHDVKCNEKLFNSPWDNAIEQGMAMVYEYRREMKPWVYVLRDSQIKLNPFELLAIGRMYH